MTDSDARKKLRAKNAAGLSWADIAHRINLLAGGDRRVVTLDAIWRFAVQGRKTRPATIYWIERWLESRASSEAAR